MHAYGSGQYVLPLPDGHRFPMAKYQLLQDRVRLELPGVILRDAPRATDGELALAHAPHYVDAISSGSISREAMREIGFPWSNALAERSRRSVGATVAAARDALAGAGVAANMAGGTHHAAAAKGGGYCVFNDVAVAARLMQAEWSRRARPSTPRRLLAGAPLPPADRSSFLLPLRVAVVDLDVHQGNGTASIFRNDDSVFTLSLHGARNFPFRKEVSDLDVELPDGCGDEAYLTALNLALEALAQSFDPQLLFFLAGADCHQGDRLGRLKLSFEGMQTRDRLVFDWAWRRRTPLALMMAGGYGLRIEDTVQCHLNTFAVALEYARRWAR